jgi:N-acetylmuramidase
MKACPGGIGQVMGAHWAWLGYADVDALIAEARGGVAGQVRLMARYIDKAGLAAAIRRCDWEAFARGYNGPQFRRHGYHVKIAAAYHRFRAESREPLPEKRNPAVRLAKRPDRKALPATAIPTKAPAGRPIRTPFWSSLIARLSGFLGRG